MSNKTLIIAEDDESIRLVTSRYLQDLGYDVILASNLKELWKLIESNKGDALITDVVNDRPNFDDRDAMKAAQDDRRKFTTFLDIATGYTSKQRGDKAKEWVKKASKAKSAISGALHFMSMAKSMSDEKREKAEGLIAEIEAALEAGDNTKAAGRGEKLSKMLNE